MIPELNLEQAVAAGIVSAFVGSLITIGYRRWTRRNSSEPVESRRQEVSSMTDITPEDIRDRLDHPDILSVHVKENESGSLTVDVEYAGNEQTLRRLVGHGFDIRDTIPNDEGGIHAMLDPNLNSF